MPKANEPTPRDLEVFETATRYSVVHGRRRLEFPDRDLAFAAAREMTLGSTRGATVYAIGESYGIETSALAGVVHPDRG